MMYSSNFHSISGDEMPDVISRDVNYKGYEYGFCGLRRWLEVIGSKA